jgi:hypothetical protein
VAQRECDQEITGFLNLTAEVEDDCILLPSLYVVLCTNIIRTKRSKLQNAYPRYLAFTRLRIWPARLSRSERDVMNNAGRVFAACIACAAWTGLIVQLSLSYSANPSLLLSLWIIFAYFTIITNFLVAVVFTSIAMNRGALRSEWVVAGAMQSIVMVGVIYQLLLRGALELAGGSALVDKLLHLATPVLVPLFWIIFVRKGNLTWRHPLIWAIYPLAYFIYGMARGLATGKYAYPFLNILALGWQRTALNALFIAVAFMAFGFAIVWVDHLLSSRSAPIRPQAA